MSAQSQRVMQYLEEVFGGEPEHLWTRYPNYAVIRHPVSRKWYAAFLSVPKCKLGLDCDTIVEILNIKCDPLMLGSLLLEKGFYPAYHMNKGTWVSILLDEAVPDEKIFSLLNFSYDSVAPKRKSPSPKGQ